MEREEERKERYLKLAAETGFDHVGLAAVDTLHTMPEVREMCASGKCKAYNGNWTCPPVCGTVEECQAKIQAYDYGILVQTTAVLEDSFDFEGMMDGEQKQRDHVSEFLDKLVADGADVLPLATGGCRICKTCTYPDQPCRFPKKAHSSMEGYGLLVSKVCQDNGLGYYYGKDTVTYTALFLIKNEMKNEEGIH